jgi:hypothetical protein
MDTTVAATSARNVIDTALCAFEIGAASEVLKNAAMFGRWRVIRKAVGPTGLRMWRRRVTQPLRAGLCMAGPTVLKTVAIKRWGMVARRTEIRRQHGYYASQWVSCEPRDYALG